MTPQELKSRMKFYHLSQVDVARALGVRPETVWRWINGKVRMTGPVIRALDSLMGGIGETREAVQ